MKRITLNTLFIFATILASASATAQPDLQVVASEQEGKATVKIVGYINEWSRASAADLDLQINDLIAAGHKDCHVYINSKGGSTLEASEIYNSLKRFPGKLIAHAGAIVGSAAGWLACNCDEFHVHANTQFMWHKPRAILQGTYDEIISNAKLLKNTEDDYLEVYANKTGKTKEQLAALWDKGDQWLMGKEIVAEGFATHLIKRETPVSEADVKLLEALGAPVVPQATATIQSPENTDTGMKINPLAIGLKADATEQEINARLEELNAKAAKADQLEQERKDNEKAAKEKAISDLLTAAIQDKKITAEQKPHYEKLLKADFDSAKAIIEALTPVGNLSAQVTPGSATSGVKGREDWTFADWQTKDPQGLQKMHEDSPEKFDKLFNAQN